MVLLLGCAAVYMLGGYLHYKRRGGTKIPNAAFWRALPGLVGDGVGFTLAKLKGEASRGRVHVCH